MSYESLNIYGLEPHNVPSSLDMSAELSAVSSQVETVPPKLYNVKVVQFWRGEKEPLRPYPLHWAIYVETSPGIGNTYQLVGNQTDYTIDIKLNQPLENSEDSRGSYSVGSVSQAELTELETILPRVDIIHNVPWWNSQDWVDDALRYLKSWGFSDIIGEMELACLQENMCWILECRPGIENAVEFVGDSEDLACILSNRRYAEAHRRYWKVHTDWREVAQELERLAST
ncbi:uncharacterized protein EDB93DRAFT_1252500 [Suillus bovinus]|uniref:uncharacterized protein n=1 Tax=Suillus bovinus TaxID=48563 RepID=UPI001B884307|nr:uncharacterized protein EDB93DRAFT_1252500 [Suillus bovinus]KAG2141815.1 hypothetical protein EDB93DRAFT_1252500 [Suillus bovinus]